MNSNSDISIVLVDDHALFRNGLRGLIDGKRGCRVVAEFADGESFIEALGSLPSVDIVFMDISMSGINGDEATRQALALRPELRIVALTMFGDRAYYVRMIDAGAKGFLLKDTGIDEVFEAIECVKAGEEYVAPSILQGLTPSSLDNSTEIDSLSEREIDVLTHICRGLSTQQIADALYLSKRTVDAHRANILEKTGCNNTASLVVYAIKHNLVEI